MTAVIVIAKEPRPGRAKTRLCPPCTPEDATRLAAAALADTLDVVSRTAATRHVLALDGAPRFPIPSGFDVAPQRGAGLAQRIGAAFSDVGGPALLVGMDTPQMTPDLLDAGLEALATHDAVIGDAVDGGFWAIGLRRPDPAVFDGVPMSTSATGRRQRERLDELGLSCASLPTLRDVDEFDDALAVASESAGTRFAAATERVADRLRREAGVAR